MITTTKDTIITKDEKLIRRGNLLNTLGILRAAAIHDGCIEKVHFAELVKRNWLISPEKHDAELEHKIDIVWHDAKEKFVQMQLLDVHTSTNTKFVLLLKSKYHKVSDN